MVSEELWYCITFPSAWWERGCGACPSIRSDICPSVCPSVGQTAQGFDLKLGWYIHHATPQIWFRLLVTLCCIPAISWPSIYRAISAYFQTNHAGDRSQTTWIYSLWYSPDTINFWSCSAEFLPFSGLWFIEQFPLFLEKCRSDGAQILVSKAIRDLAWPD